MIDIYILLGFWTKLMVVGGTPNTAYYRSEIYDLSGQNLTCPTISNYPIQFGSVGTYINNKALVCGGYTFSGFYFSDCYSYNAQVSI